MLPAMVYWSEVKYTSEIVQVTVYRFLPARKRGTCYGNVSIYKTRGLEHGREMNVVKPVF